MLPIKLSPSITLHGEIPAAEIFCPVLAGRVLSDLKILLSNWDTFGLMGLGNDNQLNWLVRKRQSHTRSAIETFVTEQSRVLEDWRGRHKALVECHQCYMCYMPAYEQSTRR